MSSVWKRITSRNPRSLERVVAYIAGSAAIAVVLIYGLDLIIESRGAESLAIAIGFPGGGVTLAAFMGGLLGIYFLFGRRKAVISFAGLLIGLTITIIVFMFLVRYEWVLDAVIKSLFGEESILYIKVMIIFSMVLLIVRLGSQFGSALVSGLLRDNDTIQTEPLNSAFSSTNGSDVESRNSSYVHEGTSSKGKFQGYQAQNIGRYIYLGFVRLVQDYRRKFL
jgi:hypothetical protein